ncbi:MAG: hypothetical protein K2K91_05075 [Ruminococcus sp.]|nr:hypothetical protein [Ruminococcus sp.]MDE7099363.1 hypothetical protein [Ruminococcus sp.]
MITDSFKIEIDTSLCEGLTAECNLPLNDMWYYKDLSFESGKIYGLVSEYGQGCEFVSYLLGGRIITLSNIRIIFNGNQISQSDLSKMSWNLEASEEKYGDKIVRKSIENALKNTPNSINFQDLAEKFALTPERYDRKFKYLSGERWRAAAAFGYAQNKRIYFSPYKTSLFYYQMCQSSLLKGLRALTDSGALVVLPSGGDKFIRHIVDEVIYLDKDYDIETLQSFYSKNWGADWIK